MKKYSWLAFLCLSMASHTMDNTNDKTPQEEIIDSLMEANQGGFLDVATESLADKYPEEIEFILQIKGKFSTSKPQFMQAQLCYMPKKEKMPEPKVGIFMRTQVIIPDDHRDHLLALRIQEEENQRLQNENNNQLDQDLLFALNIQKEEEKENNNNNKIDQDLLYALSLQENDKEEQQEQVFLNQRMYQVFQEIGYQNKESMTQLKDIVNHFSKISQGTDVHQLDQFCLDHSAQLLKISELFHPVLRQEKAKKIHVMNLQDLLGEMKSFINENNEYFQGFMYEDQAISLNELHQLLQQQVTRAVNEGFLVYGQGQGTALWAHAFALIVELHHDLYLKDESKHKFVVEFFRSFVEGLKTQGGCVPGFFDRGMARLAFQLVGFNVIKN